MAFICNQIAPTSASDLLVKIEAELDGMGWELHDKYIPFTAGKSVAPEVGDTIEGLTSGATAVIVDVVITAGSFAGNNAAGFFGISTVTGQFVAENIKNNTHALNPAATINGYYYVVYKSNGEDSDRIYEYMYFRLSSTTILIYAYGWWNNATHTGLCNTGGSSLIYVAGEKLVISGTKNLVVTHRIGYSVVGTYDTMFGHIPKRFYSAPLATLTAPVTAGDGKTLSLDNTTKFIPNQALWIFGAAGEGRDRIKITSVNPGVSITGDGLTIGFDTGAKIGAFPNMFGCYYNSLSSFCLTQNRIVGTDASGTAISPAPFVPITALDPDQSLGQADAPLNTEGLYVLQPRLFYGSGAYAVGYSDNYVLYPPIATNDTIIGITADGQALSTGTATDGSSVTLTCAGKTWGVNDYADKTVWIKAGTGAGYSRRIVSNTATVLTIARQWDVTPNNTSEFNIVDEVYRTMGILTVAYRELI